MTHFKDTAVGGCQMKSEIQRCGFDCGDGFVLTRKVSGRREINCHSLCDSYGGNFLIADATVAPI